MFISCVDVFCCFFFLCHKNEVPAIWSSFPLSFYKNKTIYIWKSNLKPGKPDCECFKKKKCSENSNRLFAFFVCFKERIKNNSQLKYIKTWIIKENKQRTLQIHRKMKKNWSKNKPREKNENKIKKMTFLQ